MKLVGGVRVYSIPDVAEAVRRRLTKDPIPLIWVEGEIANFQARRDHTYFTLVDHRRSGDSQVAASMLSDRLSEMAVTPRDGANVHAFGRVEFDPRRLRMRFRVERLELAGEGLLRARIEQLRTELARRGLTDPARRRPLPRLPRAVGLVTSGEGAAKDDFLRNLHARFPAVDVVVVHSLVQGDRAPGQIVRAIAHLDARPEVEVIVLARGGGPLEDLMAFNSEAVCLAVAASSTPVVSAIGHDTDRPLTDLVADLRVSTPTKAAEAVVPDRARELARLADLDRSAAAAVARRVGDAASALERTERRLVFGLRTRGATAAARTQGLDARLAPALRARLARADDRLATAQRTLDAALQTGMERRRTALDHAAAALAGRVTAGLHALRARTAVALDDRSHRLDAAVRLQLERRRTTLERAAAQHEILSPVRTVARGYVIVRDAATRRVRTASAEITLGERLALQFRDGERLATAQEERV